MIRMASVAAAGEEQRKGKEKKKANARGENSLFMDATYRLLDKLTGAAGVLPCWGSIAVRKDLPAAARKPQWVSGLCTGRQVCVGEIVEYLTPRRGDGFTLY